MCEAPSVPPTLSIPTKQAKLFLQHASLRQLVRHNSQKRFCFTRTAPQKFRVVHGTYLSVPFPSHSNLCLSRAMRRFPWDSHRNDIPMDKPRVVHGTYLSVPSPSHSNLCLSHPMGRFPWDSHRNPIPTDKPGHLFYLENEHKIQRWTKTHFQHNCFRPVLSSRFFLRYQVVDRFVLFKSLFHFDQHFNAVNHALNLLHLRWTEPVEQEVTQTLELYFTSSNIRWKSFQLIGA